jgi:hypothetical protein
LKPQADHGGVCAVKFRSVSSSRRLARRGIRTSHSDRLLPVLLVV